tara:strand:+ start:10330 stop:10485 length:156 start_codon:yes stop_codon:yes gene_type:complete
MRKKQSPQRVSVFFENECLFFWGFVKEVATVNNQMKTMMFWGEGVQAKVET